MHLNPRITIDLTKAGEQRIALPPCNRLWIPPSVIVDGAEGKTVVENGTDFVLGIQLGYDDSHFSEMIPFGLANGLATSYGAPAKVILVTVLTKGAGNVAYLQSGVGITLGYGSSDGLSPQVGGGIVAQ